MSDKTQKNEQTAESSASAQPRETTTSAEPQSSSLEQPTQPRAWVGYLVLTGLAIYAFFLSMLALDETFDFGWFPTVLEKQVREQIDLYVNGTEEQQEKAHSELIDGEMFVVVPELIRKLSDPSPDMRRGAHQILLEVTPHRLNAEVIGYSPDDSPERRKKTQKELWTWWERVETDFY